MSDERPGPAGTDDDADEQADRRRSSAQGAAADLARMGIDPTALGLDAPAPAVDDAPNGPASARSGPASAAGTAGGFGAGWDLTAPPAPPARADAPRVRDAEPDSDAGARVVPLRPEWGVGADSPLPAASAAPAPVRPARSRAVEDLLARTSPPAPQRRSTPGLLGTVARGLATPDAAEGVANERELVAAVRTRQTRRRLVAFLAGKGGVGTTTVAVGVGTALSALREDPIALVDLGTGTPPLSAVLGAQPGPRARDLLRVDASVEPTASPAGLALVDASPWDAPLRRTETGPVLDLVGADHAFTLLDIGTDPGEAGRVGLARADLVVVVTGPGSWGAAATRTALQRLEDVDPFALDSVVHVVVAASQAGHDRLCAEMAAATGADLARVVALPPDDVLASGRPYDPASVSPALRAAVLRLAAAIAVSGGTPGSLR